MCVSLIHIHHTVMREQRFKMVKNLIYYMMVGAGFGIIYSSSVIDTKYKLLWLFLGMGLYTFGLIKTRK